VVAWIPGLLAESIICALMLVKTWKLFKKKPAYIAHIVARDRY
jgi:hypothetical protein